MNWPLSRLFIQFLSLAVFAGSAQANSDVYYTQLFEDGKLDIMIALGYEQNKLQKDVKVPYAGKAPIIGPAVNAAATGVGTLLKEGTRDIENTLRDVNGIEAGILDCIGCNFKKTGEGKGYRTYKTETQYKNKKIAVRVHLIYSEPGVSAETLKSWFIYSLGNDDAIVYLGHARHGDGFPDFATPLANTGKVFYNDPVEGWKGFEKGYFSKSKYQILYLNACQTWRYFQKVIRTRVWEKDPSKLGVIMSSDDTWFEDYPATVGAFLQNLMDQVPREEFLQNLDDMADFYKQVHMNDETQKKLFLGDGFFDTTYVPKPAPKKKQPLEPWRDMPF